MEFGFYQLAAAAAVMGLFLVAAVYKVVHDGSAKSATAYTSFGFFAAVTTALIGAVPEALKITREFPEFFGGSPPIQAAAPVSQPEIKSVERVEKTIIIERLVAAPAPASAPHATETGYVPTAIETPQPAARSATPAHPKTERKAAAKITAGEPAKFAVAAMGPLPTAKPAAPAETEPPATARLATAIKLELQRLNCFKGSTDGQWGKDAISAVHNFNVYGYRRVADAPEEETLSVLKGFDKPVCP